MRDSRPLFALRTYALAFAVVLSPAFLQGDCARGNTQLSSLELEVDGGPNLIVGFATADRSYDVSTNGSTVTVRAQAVYGVNDVSWQWLVGTTTIGSGPIGTGGGEVTLPVPIPDGQSVLRVAVKSNEVGATASGYYAINIERAAGFPCTEQGIRDAIAQGGGPHVFACNGPTTVTTTSEIVIDNPLDPVSLDGEGNLTVDGNGTHRVFSVSAGATVFLQRMTISGGNAGGEIGGGILNEGWLVLINSTVTGNSAGGGGGVSNSRDLLLFYGSTVTGNSAWLGGGIYNYNASSRLSVSQSTISANEGDGVYSIGGDLTFTNSTISGNSGDGIINGGTLQLRNSTLSGNGAYAVYGGVGQEIVNSIVQGPCINIFSSVATYSIESPADTCGFPTGQGNQVNVSAAELSLGPLQDNGGGTFTHAPLSGSVAIDVIPEAACVEEDGSPLSNDQRGMWRPENVFCDVGAVEGYCPDCNDGLLCTVDTCDPVTRMCSGPPVICQSDGSECSSDVCDPSTGACQAPDGTPCDSGNGQCVSGLCDLCAGVTCTPDGIECTSDACDPATGACYPPAPDGTPCASGNGECVAGVCDLCAGVVCTPDGNDCTSETCNPSTGACESTTVPDGTSCDSGHAVCQSGACRGPEALNCWDKIFCAGWTGPGPIDSENYEVVMDGDGNGMVIWSQRPFTGPLNLVGKSYSVADGWGSSFRIDNLDAENAYDVDVAMYSNGNAIAVWKQWLAGTGQTVWANHYTPGGGWAVPEPISVTGGASLGFTQPPQVAVDRWGWAIAVWEEHQTTPPYYTVWSNQYTSLGWGTPSVISGPGAERSARHADVAMAWSGAPNYGPSTGMAVWTEESATATYTIWARRYRHPAWQTPVQLGVVASADDAAQVAMNSGNSAIAVWRNAPNEIWANRFTDASGWGTAELLVTADLPSSGLPALTLAMQPWESRQTLVGQFYYLQVDGIVAWTQWNGANLDLWAKRYTPSGGWGTAELLESHDGEAIDPKVAMDTQGNAVVVWERCRPPCESPTWTDVWINRYRLTPYPHLGPNGWGAAEFFESESGGQDPKVAMDSNRDGTVVWSGQGLYAQTTRWTSAPAPHLSNARFELVELNDPVCGVGSSFRYRADYWDSDGDIVSSPEEDAARIFVDLTWSNSSWSPRESYESAHAYNQVTGTGFSGTITASNCLQFGPADWTDVSLTVWDTAGNESPTSEVINIPKPPGAE